MTDPKRLIVTLTFGERAFTVKGWGGVHTYAYHRLDRVGHCGGTLFFATGGRDFDFALKARLRPMRRRALRRGWRRRDE